MEKEKEYSALNALIGCSKVDKFLSGDYESEPCFFNNVGVAPDLLSIDDIDRFLATIKYRTAECFCVDGNSPIDVTEFSDRGVINARKVLSLFNQGATLILNRVQLYHPPLALFCEKLSNELGAPCQANVYMTPPGARGFDVHYDTHDVLIAQVAGEKSWSVFNSVIDLPLASQGTSERPEVTSDPRARGKLSPGNVLYIPRGWAHEGTTENAISLHITFGVYAFTWADLLLEAVSDAILNDVDYRRSLPIDFFDQSSDIKLNQATLSELLARLGKSASVASLRPVLHEQLRAQTGAGVRHLLSQICLSKVLDDSTRLRVDRSSLKWLKVEADRSKIGVPMGVVELREAAASAFNFCLRNEEVSVSDLSEWLPEQDRIEFVRNLISKELLRVCT
ncbi:cupin domain-containing protein [Leisingera aquaemixtae]|uniref:cupin domain-containing protein n=1 Tax=Leisingera aquaemixtae TaxID=1396826 RepID=UPI0021A6708B|nr:cupin domain-containing protein [Leisingera aquaemixtae]UWQ46863.1 cupin domain-containing protein [Leisingera aquaemixtae]